jgi:hypothetical protein
VADLIHYALGQASSADRQQVETHLHQAGCSQCRSWIEKAARFRAEPLPGANPGTPGLSAHLNLPRSSPPLLAEQTPLPESSRWQREAFRDLEQRLRLLETL